MIPLPQISVDSMSYLKPELLGLCAWLGLSNVYAGDRTRVLCHVAKHGVLDGLEPGLLSEEDRASAKAAHSDWLDYLAAIAPDPKAPAIVFHRNGHAPVPSSSFGHPAQEMDGDDIAF